MTISKSGSNFYEIVRKKLILGPVIAPKHKKIFDLMETFWNNEEIEILSHFNSADEGINIKTLQERTGKSRVELKKILDVPIKKGTIQKFGSKYYLLPLLPGVFEDYFMRRNDSEENLKKIAKIYQYLFKNYLPQFYDNTNFKLFRTRLPLDAKEKLIEVDHDLGNGRTKNFIL